MREDELLAEVARIHGVCLDYRDMQGVQQVASPDTLRALLAANGVAAENRAQLRDSLAEYRADQKQRTAPQEMILASHKATMLGLGSVKKWRLQCEATGAVVANGTATEAVELPELASGIYMLAVVPSNSLETVRIIVAPLRAPGIGDMTERERLWGINLALYGLRSERNLGLGDYSDLAEMCRIGGQLGAGFIGTNPVHAAACANSVISPYSPSHRGFLNTAHIDIGAIPGLLPSPTARRILAELGTAPETLRSAPIVEYDLHQTVQQKALASLHCAFQLEAPAEARDTFATFRRQRGKELVRFARFEADARSMAAGCSNGLGEDREDSSADREEFQIWLQWVADHQLKNAHGAAREHGMAPGLYLDLAVGARRDGAESWCNRDVIAHDVALGAPPDHVNPEGQNWNLAAYSPRKLASRNYRPLRNLLTATMRHAGMLRIDHILGLSRSFWIPDDGSPGGYVRQPFETNLAILKIEAERARTILIGEDLGLVPRGFRDTMKANGIYGYSVAQYERNREGRLQWAAASRPGLSCFSTHDTPTVLGFETGRDIAWWRKLGWINADRQHDAQRQRKRDVDDLSQLCPNGDFTTRVHSLLAHSDAAMVSIQLDDICEHQDAQNLPGTTDEHLNWRRKYTIAIEDILNAPRMRTLSRLMNRGRRMSPGAMHGGDKG